MARQKKSEAPAGYVAAKTLVADGRYYKAGETLDVRPGVLACMIRTGQAVPIDAYEVAQREQQAAAEEEAREEAIANAAREELLKEQQRAEETAPPGENEPPEDPPYDDPPPEPQKRAEPKTKTTSKK